MSTDPPPPFKITGHLGIARAYGLAERATVTADWDGRRLSIVGNRGQNVESVTQAEPYPDDGRTAADRARIAAIWDRWHLNDARAGCEHQERGIRAFGLDGLDLWRRRAPADLYASGAPCGTCGYRYGSGWNFEPVPAAVLRELAALLDDGIWHRDPPADDDDEPEDFPHADRIDSGHLIGRNFGPEINAELEDAEGYAADWNFGATLIAAEDFENYAQEFAEDIGAIPDGNAWPLYCIDWSHAARELAMDYSTVTIDGRDYMVRS